eukprot:808369-Amphidinium_carterae.1
MILGGTVGQCFQSVLALSKTRAGFRKRRCASTNLQGKPHAYRKAGRANFNKNVALAAKARPLLLAAGTEKITETCVSSQSEKITAA